MTVPEMLQFLVLIILHYPILILNGIELQVFFKKNTEKKHLCHHDKNHYYFCKSNIPVMNLIVGSSIIIRLSKNMSL